MFKQSQRSQNAKIFALSATTPSFPTFFAVGLFLLAKHMEATGTNLLKERIAPLWSHCQEVYGQEMYLDCVG